MKRSALALLLASLLALQAAVQPLFGGPRKADATASSEAPQRGAAQQFNDESFPGGIVRVAAPAGTQIAIANGRRALIERGLYERGQPQEVTYVIAAVPLDAQPGSGRVFAQHANGSVALPYRIASRAYPVQRLTLSNQRMVDPDPQDVLRIDAEQLLIDAARDRFSPIPPQTLRLRAPVQGRLSSPFGSRRVLNGQPRNPHNGLDFAAPTGARISAPLAGEVAGVGNYFFTGNTVFIDHGQGFVTMYAHLSHVAVTPGMRLAAGDLIGQVGATGRATGPHLHWAVYLSNVAIDPKLLLDAASPPAGEQTTQPKQ